MEKGGGRERREAAREEEEETEWKRLMASDTVVIKRQSGGGETAENSNRLDVDEHEMSRETLFLSFGNANTSGCLFFFFFTARFLTKILANRQDSKLNLWKTRGKKNGKLVPIFNLFERIERSICIEIERFAKKWSFNLSIFIIPYRLLRGILSVMNDRIFSSKRRN